MSKKNPRRQSRELALQIEFQREFLPQYNVDDSVFNFSKSFDLDEDILDYSKFLLKGIDQKKSDIDDILNNYSPNWNVSRMALVDLNILRIAIFEMFFSEADVPPKVAINEAIELSKKYGNTESANFVNGILAEIIKSKQV